MKWPAQAGSNIANIANVAESALSTTRLAELAGVHQTTIIKAIQAGRIHARTTPGGHFRIAPADAAEFLRAMGIDPGPLSRRRVHVLGLVDEPKLAAAIGAAVGRDARFELTLEADPLKAGMLVERLSPEIAVIDTRLLNGHRRDAVAALHAADVRVLALGGDPLDAADAWLELPFSIEEFVYRLRELAEGTRVWKRAKELQA